MAAACLYLGGKVREQPKKLKDFLPQFHKLSPRTDTKSSPELDVNSAAFAELRSKVMGYEVHPPFRLFGMAPRDSIFSLPFLFLSCSSWLQRILLHVLNFDFTFEDPFHFLFKCAKEGLAGSKEQKKPIVQTAFNFLNDSFATTLCLLYSPQVGFFFYMKKMAGGGGGGGDFF